MRVAHIDPVTDPRWRELVDGASGPTAFAHPAWLALLAARYRYAVTALAVLDGGELVLGLPLARVASRLTGRRIVSLPFTDACPAVARDGASAEAGIALATALADERRRTGLALELRHTPHPAAGGHVVTRFVSHRLSLDPPAAARPAARRGVAKARREGVTVRMRTDRAALADFYRLHLRTRRRQGVPVQPRGFILGLEALFAQGLGHVASAHVEDRVVAAAVFLTHGDTTIYKYGASDERMLHVRPNNLLFAEAIQRARAAGHRTLDLGRTDLGNAGLGAFKRAWGADETPLAYTYLADRPPRPAPGPARRAVAGLIRHTPARTGQLVGTALYRHVG